MKTYQLFDSLTAVKTEILETDSKVPFRCDNGQEWYSFFSAEKRVLITFHRDTMEYLQNPERGLLVRTENKTSQSSGEPYVLCILCEPEEFDGETVML